jgi:hypothetical protein
MRNLFKVFTRIDGAKFQGHLTASTAAGTAEKPPYRVLHVRTPTFVRVGDVIRSMGGEYIILMEQPDNFSWAITFKAAYVNEIVSWTRTIKIEDPVARVTRDAMTQDLGSLYVNFTNPEELNLSGVIEPGYRFITGQAVQVGDKVGDKVIKRIVEALGVKIVYAV